MTPGFRGLWTDCKQHASCLQLQACSICLLQLQPRGRMKQTEGRESSMPTPSHEAPRASINRGSRPVPGPIGGLCCRGGLPRGHGSTRPSPCSPARTTPTCASCSWSSATLTPNSSRPSPPGSARPPGGLHSGGRREPGIRRPPTRYADWSRATTASSAPPRRHRSRVERRADDGHRVVPLERRTGRVRSSSSGTNRAGCNTSGSASTGSGRSTHRRTR